MESDHIDMGITSGVGSVNSRWNPTKEQISLLESLYRQGIRTPTADQIQQITGKLKAYGHIEGKNVFYWFQNHKARQRQKRKQESMGFNRYLHNALHHQPDEFAPPCPYVVCSAYYLRQSDIGFYPHYCKALFPDGFKRRARAEKILDDKTKSYVYRDYEPAVMSHQRNQENMDNERNNNQGTLPLFPLNPTGFLKHGKETTMSSLDLISADENSTQTTACIDEDGSFCKPFFDFFSGRAPFES